MKKLFVFLSIIMIIFSACNFDMLLPKEKIVYVKAEEDKTTEEKKESVEKPETAEPAESAQPAEKSEAAEPGQTSETQTTQTQPQNQIQPQETAQPSETQSLQQQTTEPETSEQQASQTSQTSQPTSTQETTQTFETTEPTEPAESSQPSDSNETAEPTQPTEPAEPVEPPAPAKLTLIVYMAADNDLEQYAIENLKAMEKADFENINVLALIDRAEGYDETNGNWTDTRLFEVLHDDTDSGFLVSKRLDCPPLGLSARLRTELDMGNYNVLKNLIAFAKSQYEAEQYALIIWGHGTGWRYSNPVSYRAVGIDEKTDTYMTVCDMGKALKNQDLAVIGFDTCFGGVFENLYELQYSSEYLVASPGVSPSSGWDYKNLLETISQRDVSASDIANLMAENSPVHTTVVNTSRIQNIMNALEDFSEQLSSTIINSTTRNSAFNALFNAKSYSYTQYPCDMYIDIFDMANIYAESEKPSLSEAAEKLKTAISRAGHTSNSRTVEIGLHLIPLKSAHTANYYHSEDYLKDPANMTQGAFIKESQWWVPTKNNDSDSLLDKLFYQ